MLARTGAFLVTWTCLIAFLTPGPASAIEPPASDTDAATATRIRFDGDLRVRTLLARGLDDVPLGVDLRRSGTYHRVRIGAAMQRGSLDARVELQSSGAFGAAGPQEAPLAVGLQQAWMRYRLSSSRFLFSVEAGRLSLHYGSGRQIGSYDMHPTGNAFDGLRLRGELDNVLQVDLLATRLRRDANQPELQRSLYGVHASATPTGSLKGDVYLLILRDGAQADEHDLQTMGIRVQWQPWGIVLAEMEAALQFGRRNDSDPTENDRLAHMLVLNLGAQGTLGLAFSGGLTLELYSGDDDPTDGVERAWRPLYPDLDRVVGLLQRFAPSNLRTLGGWLQAGGNELWSIRLVGRLLSQRVAEADTAVGDGWQAIGGELDLALQLRPHPFHRISLLGGVLLPSSDPLTGAPTDPIGVATLLEWRGQF
ncbi:MAG: alginate export family protein [Deltaproteobacteria bacterium]|nr:alginate export family protein [Deltaproteobacteria bacterium]